MAWSVSQHVTLGLTCSVMSDLPMLSFLSVLCLLQYLVYLIAIVSVQFSLFLVGRWSLGR